MGQLERLRALVSKISYKPNFRIEITTINERGMLTAAVRITAHVVDSTKPVVPVPITGSAEQPMIKIVTETPAPMLLIEDDEQLIVKMIYHMLREFETHECDEWFRFDGEVIYDPHRNDRTPA